jgi:hypothetical protein
MPTKKERRIISADEVTREFNAARIEKLAKIAALPPTADLFGFGEAVREAVRIFARDARVPNVNAVNDEIAALWKLADSYRAKPTDWEGLALAVENLSPRAREMLAKRDAEPSVATELPAPGTLRDPRQRDGARDAIATLVQCGGQWVAGRGRGNGKRSRPTWRPLLYAPAKQKHATRRDAERDFIIWLSIAWLEAMGEAPSRTARHRDASRDLGPFARLARECLRLVGAGDADVVELINELNRRRGKKQVRI